MRIALVSEHASPLAGLGGVDAGGQNVHVAALAGELAELGHHVDVYTRRDAPELPAMVPMRPGVDVVHVPAGPDRAVPKDDLLPWMADFGAWLGERWLADGPPDVVHAHFWMSGLAALQAARAQPVPVPVLQTFHALGSVKRRHQRDRDTSPSGRVQTEAGLGRSVDLVVATCRDEVAELRRLGVPVERIAVVPCGVDVERFRPARAEVAEPTTTPRDGLDADGTPDGAVAGPPMRALSLGRLVERKGVDTVIEALAGVDDVELDIAGGPGRDRLDDDAEVQRLRRLAADVGVADRVHFLGAVDHDDVPAVIGRTDVVVATPWYEPFGIVPLEAAACGKPLVGTAVGGLLDTVQDGVTGILVPPRDAAAVARALRSLSEDPARRHRIGAAARRRAVERYGWDHVARETALAYESLLDRGDAARSAGYERAEEAV